MEKKHQEISIAVAVAAVAILKGKVNKIEMVLKKWEGDTAKKATKKGQGTHQMYGK